MITELDNKYLVLNWDSINAHLNNSEMRNLDAMLKKIAMGRSRAGKNEKNYTVVSETMDAYNTITQMVLDDINNIPTVSSYTKEDLEKAVKEAVTKATTKIAPKKKITQKRR